MKANSIDCTAKKPDTGPLLGVSEEEVLCRRWHEHHDVVAAERIIGSHRHLVAGIAEAHRDCGVRKQELIGEGYVGLMRAVCHYDPDCGTSFGTYAAWWVRDAIGQSILRASRTMHVNAIGVEPAMLQLYRHGSRRHASVLLES